MVARFQLGRSTISNISGNSWGLPIHLLRVIGIFSLQWEQRSAPPFWERLDWGHCTYCENTSDIGELQICDVSFSFPWSKDYYMLFWEDSQLISFCYASGKKFWPQHFVAAYLEQDFIASYPCHCHCNCQFFVIIPPIGVEQNFRWTFILLSIYLGPKLGATSNTTLRILSQFDRSKLWFQSIFALFQCFTWVCPDWTRPQQW